MSNARRRRARVPPLPPETPGTRNPLTRLVGRWMLALRGWSIEGEVPPLGKFVAIFAPHTSNWDFIVGLAMKWSLAIDAKWIGKHTLFRWPLGAVMRAFGGVPVNRDSPQGLVVRVAQMFDERDRFVLALAPEGTRGGHARWKSGFWHIAREARVPVVPISIDYARRACRIGAPAAVSGDYDRDLARFREFFASVTGARPDHYVAPGC